ncbi:MAG: tRNA glutamyl-Q(34) synthetase GluQRS, partial [Bacteroidales bacterium]|nr:tRNA glutamyl-Q(34) synthetase GluQRS [Bacteroidales bacterium]
MTTGLSAPSPSTPGDNRVKGRFAPSPTGRMHLGNVFSALLSWLSARSKGGGWLLRI